jgi:hypothetical protein
LREIMSIKVMSAVWENAPVRQGKLLVLLAMADYADERGACWPSVPNLAKKAHVSERHARRILRQLEREHLIVREKLTGRYEPNIYRIFPGRGDILTPLKEKQGGHLGQPGGTSATSRGDTQTPQSVTEPSREPSSGCIDSDDEETKKRMERMGIQ